MASGWGKFLHRLAEETDLPGTWVAPEPAEEEEEDEKKPDWRSRVKESFASPPPDTTNEAQGWGDIVGKGASALLKFI